MAKYYPMYVVKQKKKRGGWEHLNLCLDTFKYSLTLSQEHRHCVVCGSPIYPLYSKEAAPSLCSDRCREVWRNIGTELGLTPHKHCVVCGRPIHAIYVTPSSPPLCSSGCMAVFEAQRAGKARWSRISNIILILMILWILFILLLPKMAP